LNSIEIAAIRPAAAHRRWTTQGSRPDKDL
jgi:hypothetical protein